jgi:predicted dehydrogenase
MTSAVPVRIGALGAARITPSALIRPARELPDVEVRAIAARDPDKARAFARKHRIPVVHETYEALLADPDIDAIYNPLPNSHHAPWSIAAMRAGKHVLCEKPLAANAEEARAMAAVAKQTGRVLMEAFHWRYHPLADRLAEIVDRGELGAIRHVEAAMCIPLLLPNDIRFRLDLAGGAMMDVGCYTINIVRFLAGADPEVVSAVTKLSSPGVDRWARAELRFADGRTGRITCALRSSTLLDLSARVDGEYGSLRVTNPTMPHLFHRVRVDTRDGRRTERVPGSTTYVHQLRAFLAAVRDGHSFPSTPEDAVRNMAVIDAVYTAAGLSPRQPLRRDPS